MRPHVRHYSTTRFIAAASERQLQTYFTPIRAVVRYRGGGQGGQWGIRKSKQSGRYAHTRGTREVRGATWSPNPALTHELPTSHDCARASTRNGQRAHTLHSAYYGQIARTWRRGGAHTRRARAHIVGRCAAATRQPRTTGQSQGGRARHQKIGRSPTRDTSHYGRAGGRPVGRRAVRRVGLSAQSGDPRERRSRIRREGNYESVIKSRKRSQPTSLCQKSVVTSTVLVRRAGTRCYTPTLVSRVCVEASRGARHFEVAHATRATLRRSLLAASARTGRARA